MVIAGQLLVDIVRRRTIDEDIMGGLDIEGFFHLGVRCSNQIDGHNCYDKQIE